MKRTVILLLWGIWAFAWAAETAAPGFQAQALIREGRALYSSGRIDEAFAKFQKLRGIDPENLVANHYLARIHALRGEFRSAIDIIRGLQQAGVSIYRSQDSKTTLNAVVNGILAEKDLAERANQLVHFRETLRGLPASVDRRIDAHLMAIYAKLGETPLYDVVRGRYFRSRVDADKVYFTAGRTFLEYGVKLEEASSHFEQAVDALREKARQVKPSGNRAADELKTRQMLAEATVAEDFLAYTYYVGNVRTPEKNRFLAREPRPGAVFKDVTADAGLPSIPAPRVAVGDYDGDGRQDLALRGRVFRNVDGKTFSEVTEIVRIDPRGTVTSIWLDYNNDGRLDLLCGTYPRLTLWRNRPDGTFTNAVLPAALGFQLGGVPEAFAAADYDGDGDLDLFVGCFEHPQRAAVGQANYLLRNKGNGRFEDVSEQARLYVTETVKDASTGRDAEQVGHYCTRGASWADYNNDRHPDLYVANYRLHPNRLWTSKGDGTFADHAHALGVRGRPGPDRYAGAYGHSIACAWGDIDNDGDLDLVTTNIAMGRFLLFADTTSLYVNQGADKRWRFENGFAKSGIRFQEMSTGVSLCDYDNDGDVDLYVSAIYKERPTSLYQNAGECRFEQVTWRANALAFGTWGHAWFDKDNDGDMDLVVAGTHDVRLFENLGSENQWLRIRLLGKKSNRFAVGARIYVEAGGKSLLREVRCDLGNGGQPSSVVHFGLGAEARPAKVTVLWPAGGQTTVEGVRPNQLLTIEEE